MELSFSANGFLNNLNTKSGFWGKTSPSVKQIGESGTGLTLTGRQKAVATKFRILRRNVPTINLRQLSPYNVFLLQDTTVSIERRRRTDSLTQKTLFGERFLAEQSTRFNQVRNMLSELQRESASIRKPGALNNKKASSSAPAILEASASRSAVEGEYSVTIQNLAKSQQLGSYDNIDPSLALGLSGSIKINGYSISVETSDSLASLAAKINYGEDANFNGLLDPEEDINGNGILDVINIRGVFTGEGYTGSVYIKEDINGNGVIDPAEDTNDNNRIDGNTAQTGVRAVIFGNQLILVSEESADIELRLQDPDHILETLGFLFRNSRGEVSTNRLNTNTVDAQKATVVINGERLVFPENSVEGVIAGVTLELKREGSETVSIENDPQKAIPQIVNLSASYNQAIRFLNIVISGNGAISRNLRLQTIYSEIVTALLSSLPEKIGPFESISDIGIRISEKVPTAIGQTAFEGLPYAQEDRLFIPGNGPFSFLNLLERIGLNSEENYTINIEREKITRSVYREFESTRKLLNLTAGRLQGRLDVHLQPDYGTIRFQQQVIRYYQENQEEASTQISNTVDPERERLRREAHSNIFATLA